MSELAFHILAISLGSLQVFPIWTQLVPVEFPGSARIDFEAKVSTRITNTGYILYEEKERRFFAIPNLIIDRLHYSLNAHISTV
jgi:hypothetical protein